jgi:hypothetical protein
MLLESLVQVHATLGLRPEILFLSVNIIDRFFCLCRDPIWDTTYPLIGFTALLLAAKYTDNRRGHVLSLDELHSAYCSLYHPSRLDDRSKFVQMEWKVLQVLGWEVGHPDTHTFLQMTLEEGKYESKVRHLSTYIAEVALFYKEFACTKSSVLSRASLTLALYILARMPIGPSSTDFYDIRTYLSLLGHLYQPPPVLVFKYAASQFSNASAIVTEFLQRRTYMGTHAVGAIAGLGSQDPSRSSHRSADPASICTHISNF